MSSSFMSTPISRNLCLVSLILSLATAGSSISILPSASRRRACRNTPKLFSISSRLLLRSRTRSTLVARPYVMRNWLLIESKGASSVIAASRASVLSLRMSTTDPSWSLPLLPALPAICSSCEVDSRVRPSLPYLRSTVMAVVRAGMLTPAARVSVANSTLIRLALKSSSNKILYSGSRPAWWLPMPFLSRPILHGSMSSSGFSCANSRSLACTACFSASLSSSMLSAASRRALLSQPDLENMKMIAGSSCFLRICDTSFDRVGVSASAICLALTRDCRDRSLRPSNWSTSSSS
mmetsp:Transcript_1615/g.4410  ORF Transcript_1615/g.4410 Transcript_1615/m.4410 type:complete len:294 (+) Transcript_1615:2897-3778(+)